MIVGNHTGWNYVHKYGSWGDNEAMYGYKDTRPFWEVRTIIAAVLRQFSEFCRLMERLWRFMFGF